MSSESRLLPFQPTTMANAQLAAASFLARHAGHTPELYAYELRRRFEWCEGNGWTRCISPHPLRHAAITNALDAGSPPRRSDPRAPCRPQDTEHYDSARGNLDRHGVHFLLHLRPTTTRTESDTISRSRRLSPRGRSTRGECCTQTSSATNFGRAQSRPSSVACLRTASLSAVSTNGTSWSHAPETFSTRPSPGSSRTSRM